ncbi:hypothetical protein D3C76_1599170 [compost metagenome]
MQLIEQCHTALTGHRRIEGELWRQLDATLTRGVAEGTTSLGLWVEEVGEHHDFTGAARRIVIAREHSGIHQ